MVGSGKTTLAFEIGDVLSELRIGNAAIDVDALCPDTWRSSSGLEITGGSKVRLA